MRPFFVQPNSFKGYTVKDRRSYSQREWEAKLTITGNGLQEATVQVIWTGSETKKFVCNRCGESCMHIQVARNYMLADCEKVQKMMGESPTQPAT